MGASRWVNVTVDFIEKITEKAMLVSIGDEWIWLPLSQVADADDYEEGDEDCTISVTEWIAREKGLEGEE